MLRFELTYTKCEVVLLNLAIARVLRAIKRQENPHCSSCSSLVGSFSEPPARALFASGKQQQKANSLLELRHFAERSRALALKAAFWLSLVIGELLET